MSTPDEQYNFAKYGRPKSLLSRTSTSKSTSTTATSNAKPEKEGKHGYSITFGYLGRKGYSLQLWTSSHVQRKKWLDVVDKQQQVVRDKNRVLQTMPVALAFGPQMRINCAVPYSASLVFVFARAITDRQSAVGGQRMFYGTDDGVYSSDPKHPETPPVLVLPLPDVTQVDVLEQFHLLIVLSGEL